MADVQIAVIDDTENVVNVAVPGIQGPIGTTGSVTIAQAGTAATPGIRFESDTNTGIYSPGADQLAISTGGTGRLFIDSSGAVGLNTNTSSIQSIGRLVVQNGSTTAEERFIVAANAYLSGPTFTGTYIQQGDTATTGTTFGLSKANLGALVFQNTSAALIGCNSGAPLVFATAGTERLRIDSSGRLLVGASTSYNSQGGKTPIIQFTGTDFSSANLGLNRWSADNQSFDIQFSKSRGAVGTHAVVSSNDALGAIAFSGSDGSSFIPAALIFCNTDGTPGANDMPGRLVFSTTADGAASPTERLRITSAGNVGIGTTSPGANLSIRSNRAVDVYAFTIGTSNGASFENDLTFSFNGSVQYFGNFQNFPLAFITNNSERARLDSSGRLLVGTSSARTNFTLNTGTPQIQLEGLTTATSSASLVRNAADAIGSQLFLGKTRAAALGGNTVVNSGDSIGSVVFSAGDGTNLTTAAVVSAQVDGTPGTDDMPGRLVFSTTADGAAAPTERLRITSAGVLQVADAGNITVGTTTGTKIGTATTQKIGFFDKTPVVQPTAVADATDAATVITQLNALLTRMRNLGLIAT